MREKTKNCNSKATKNCSGSKSTKSCAGSKSTKSTGSVRSKKTTEGGRCCSGSSDKKAKN